MIRTTRDKHGHVVELLYVTAAADQECIPVRGPADQVNPPLLGARCSLDRLSRSLHPRPRDPARTVRAEASRGWSKPAQRVFQARLGVAASRRLRRSAAPEPPRGRALPARVPLPLSFVRAASGDLSAIFMIW